MQQEQQHFESSGAIPASAPMTESPATAFSVQEYQQPMQAAYYSDEYGNVHYLN
jgi:hypothetical protein